MLSNSISDLPVCVTIERVADTIYPDGYYRITAAYQGRTDPVLGGTSPDSLWTSFDLDGVAAALHEIAEAVKGMR